MPRTKRSIPSESPRPAHETKHEPVLLYPFFSTTFLLNQLDDGQSNGTGLWLGSQCLSLYLADIDQSLLKMVKVRRKGGDVDDMHRPPRAIELGSGVGLGALALSSFGWDAVATDVALIVDTVLRKNVTENVGPESGCGIVQARELDWTVEPSKWEWDHPTSIASIFANIPEALAGNMLTPPFDLIISSDTIFSPDLTPCLLRTIHHLSSISGSPPAYVAIENRDPLLVSKTLQDARDVWKFDVTRVPPAKLTAALKKGGVNWADDEWEGVEIWKLQLKEAVLN